MKLKNTALIGELEANTLRKKTEKIIMLNYIIYLIISAILIFVIVIAFKAINRGIEAKHNLNKNIDYDEKKK